MIVTNIDTIANASFSLIGSKKEEGFIWVLQTFDGLRIYLRLPIPTVIITDKDLTLKNALSHIFPTSRQQLYIFYINKNIALNIKCKYQDSRDPNAINADNETIESPFYNNRTDDNFNLNSPTYANTRDYPIPNHVPNTPAGIYEFWRAMVFTAIEESFSLAWERFQALNRPSIIVYIERHLLPWKDQWAYCYISRYCNFGQRTTLPTKVSHRVLKAYLMKGTSTLFKLHKVIRTMLANVNTTFEAEVDHQATYIRLKYVGQL